jgi:hypothetical protein
MGLIKTRPNLELVLERRLVAGDLAVFVVVLECAKPLPVEKVSFTLLGHVVWFTTSQYGRHRHSSRFLEHEIALLNDMPGELAAGTHRLGTKLRLSESLPGSWEGDRLAIEYSVVVHVDIPWWPDKRVEFSVRVAAAPGPVEVDEGAVVYASHVGGPPAKGPYLELSLGRRTVRPGTSMHLSGALGNVERNRYRKLDVAVIAQESLPTGLGGQYVHEHVFGRWSVGLDNHTGELQPVPFNLDLPRTLTPAFELHGCKLEWFMQVEADVAWGVNPKLRFPITVEAGKLAPSRGVAAPLAVGSDRLRLIWSAVAKDTGLEYVDGSLHGLIGSISVEVHRSQHDGEARVVGLLEFPTLAVGLKSQRTRRGLLGDLEVELAARDADQTAAITAALGQHLTGGPAELFAADDTSLRFAIPGAGLELDALREFVASLVALAPMLEGIPAKLPAPVLVRDHVEAWRRAAQKFGASLRITDLRLVIERDGQTMSIATTYDDEGELRSTVVELDPGITIPSRHHLLWTGDFSLPGSDLAIVELAAPPTWTEGGRIALQIEASHVRLFLPAPLPDPMLERSRIESLFALGRRFRGEQGPYR